MNISHILCVMNPIKNKLKGYWVQNCSAMKDNIFIAAEDKGLGSVRLDVYPKESGVKEAKKFKSALQFAFFINY